MFGVGYFDKFLISSEDTTYSLYRKIGKPLIPLMDGYENTIGSVIDQQVIRLATLGKPLIVMILPLMGLTSYQIRQNQFM